MKHPVTVHLAVRSVVWVLALLLSLYVAHHLSHVLLMFLLALIIGAALMPLMRYFQLKLKLSRVLATLAVSGVMIVIVAAIGLLVLPSLLDQTRALASNMPLYSGKLRETYSWAQGLDQRFHVLPDIDEATRTISESAKTWMGSTLTWAGKLLGGILEGVIVIFLVLFLLHDGPEMREGLLALIPEGHRGLWAAQFEPIALKLGAYVQGMMLSIMLFGVYLAIVLSFVHLPLALALALVSALFAIIPLVGGYIGLVPAVMIALTVSPQMAAIVLVLYYLGNFVLGHFLLPIVFAKSVEVSALNVMIAILIGAELMGVAGALIAVPVMAAIQVLIQNLYVMPMRRQAAMQTLPSVKSSQPLTYRLVIGDLD